MNTTRQPRVTLARTTRKLGCGHTVQPGDLTYGSRPEADRRVCLGCAPAPEPEPDTPPAPRLKKSSEGMCGRP